jgi:Uma2 family endonuclease
MRQLYRDPDVVPPRFVSTEAFLAWEDRQEERHELIDGVAWVMPGGTRRHGRIITNIVGWLHGRLLGGPCEVLSGETRVRAPGGEILYPDVWARCGAGDLDATEIADPVVAIEVLSPGTRDKDLTRKRRVYPTIPTMRHFLFVEPKRIDVEHVACREGAWQAEALRRLDGRVELTAIRAELPIAEIYRGVIPG